MSNHIKLAPRNARHEGEALLIQIIHFSLRWQHVQPEDARSYFQDWTDSLSEVNLSEREIKSLRRVVRKLANSCSDRSGIFGDHMAVQTLPAAILAAVSVAGTQIAKLPALAIFAFVILSLGLLTAGAMLSVQQRRWRVPVEAMNKFEAELSKKLEAAKGQPSTVPASSEREFVRALDELLLGRAEIRIIMHAAAPSDTQMTEQQEGAIISSQQRPILREPETKEEKP